MDALKLAIDALALIVVLYAANQILKVKIWAKDMVDKAIEKGCPGKADFKAHLDADERFQRDVMEKRLDYQKQHDDHYRHEKQPEIHQVTMSADTLKAKFTDLMNQLSALTTRIEDLAEARRPRPR